MNKKSAHRDALLADVFSHDDFATGPAARFAQIAARHARRRRLARTALLTTTATAALVTALAFAWLPRPMPTARASAASAPKPAYEIISDAQLLALVTDRPLLVINNDGAPPQVVLFEE